MLNNTEGWDRTVYRITIKRHFIKKKKSTKQNSIIIMMLRRKTQTQTQTKSQTQTGNAIENNLGQIK